jgi:ArsR family transcriptional regulator
MNGSCIQNNDCVRQAYIIKLLGHPIRLKILSVLNNGNATVKRIQERLNLQQAVVSQHLTMLKNVGITNGTRKGPEMHYQITDPLAQRIICLVMAEE